MLFFPYESFLIQIIVIAWFSSHQINNIIELYANSKGRTFANTFISLTDFLNWVKNTKKVQGSSVDIQILLMTVFTASRCKKIGSY